MAASTSNRTAAESLRNGLQILQKMEEMSSPDASSADGSRETFSSQDDHPSSTSEAGDDTRSIFGFVEETPSPDASSANGAGEASSFQDDGTSSSSNKEDDTRSMFAFVN